MKQIAQIRSNAYYKQEDDKKEFELVPFLELVLVYSDGKAYDFNKKKEVIATVKISETRLIVSPETLQSLITELQLHQKKFNSIRENADKLNSMVKHLSK
jgi:hypothetical protein